MKFWKVKREHKDTRIILWLRELPENNIQARYDKIVNNSYSENEKRKY